MAQDFTADQLKSIAAIQTASRTILDALATVRLVVQEATDKGYGSAGAHAITDAVAAQASPQCVAQDIFDAASALSLIDTTLAATSRQGYTRLEKLRP